MDTWLLVRFVAGLVLLVAGAEALVRGASRLAALFGLSRLVIGLTIVAAGTSSPEMAVSIGAALSGQADIAVGNVVGSNIFNVLFILGICALILPLRVSSQLVRTDVPVMIGVSLLVVSRIPMRKIHTFAVPPNMVAPLLALVAIGVAASVFYGYIVIMVIIVAYVIHIPFAVRTKKWVASHPESWDDKPQQRRATRRAIRRAQPHRRSMARLGLRKPGR